MRPEFAPYVGVAWNRRYGQTAQYAGKTARTSANCAGYSACACGSDVHSSYNLPHERLRALHVDVESAVGGRCAVGRMGRRFTLSAHPELLSSIPADGAQGAAPAVIELHFSENLLTQFFRGQAEHDCNARRDPSPMPVKASVAASSDPKVMLIKPASLLAPGTYRVDWRAVSSDTHPILGNVRVQRPAMSEMIPVLLRFLLYLDLMLVFGLGLFGLYARRCRLDVRQLLRWMASLGVLLSVLSMVSMTQAISGADWQTLWPHVQMMLAHTELGWTWCLRLVRRWSWCCSARLATLCGGVALVTLAWARHGVMRGARWGCGIWSATLRICWRRRVRSGRWLRSGCC